jgi:hypothetical protein
VDALGYLPLENTESSFSIEGALADRPLLSQFALHSWPATEILTNTVVQIAVDAAGRVFSASLLVKSASPDANAAALNLARLARFQPLRWLGEKPPPPGALSWGKIIFHWHTTNAPASAPIPK